MKYVILNLDKRPDNTGDYFENCQVTYKSDALPIKLYFRDETEFLVGEATISIEDKQVLAELEFFTTDEVKRILYDELVPCVGGVTIERDSEDHENIKKIEIQSVGLDILNNDPRIKTLKGQRNAKKNN